MPWTEPRIAYRHRNEQTSKVYYSGVLRWALAGYPHSLRQASIALDVGCGKGFTVKLLEELGCYAVGLDLSEGLIREAKGRRVVLGDAVKIPFKSSSFDAITCFETIEHIAEPELIVREINRVLKPRGLFILTTPLKNPVNRVVDFLRGERTHISLMTLSSLLRILKESFSKISHESLYILPLPPTAFKRYFHFKTKLFATHVWLCCVKE